MRQPWGVEQIYSIDDPAYRGVRFIEPRSSIRSRAGSRTTCNSPHIRKEMQRSTRWWTARAINRDDTSRSATAASITRG